MPTREELVSVCSAKLMEAYIIKGRLESEGIPALLSYESAGLVFGITVDGLAEARILVPKSFVKEAKRILGINTVNGRGTSR